MRIKITNIRQLTDELVNDYDNELIIEYSKRFNKEEILNVLLNKNDKNPKEIFLIGLFYLEGIGTKIDYELALKYFNESLNLGIYKSAQEIGSMYAEGKGVKKDIDKAKEYFEIAANAGYAFSYYNLAMIYLWGMGKTKKDGQKGVMLLEESAKIGFRNAMEAMGKLYFNGIGVEKNEEEAEKWFARAYGDDWYFKY